MSQPKSETSSSVGDREAGQREPVAWWCTKRNGQDFITTDHGVAECHHRELDWTVTPLYTQAQRDDRCTDPSCKHAAREHVHHRVTFQRDDHPTEGLPK